MNGHIRGVEAVFRKIMAKYHHLRQMLEIGPISEEGSDVLSPQSIKSRSSSPWRSTQGSNGTDEPAYPGGGGNIWQDNGQIPPFAADVGFGRPWRRRISCYPETIGIYSFVELSSRTLPWDHERRMMRLDFAVWQFCSFCSGWGWVGRRGRHQIRLSHRRQCWDLG